MMGVKRVVDTSFWTDGKVDNFSRDEKYFMLYLLTSPFSSQLGIYEISLKQMAFQLDFSVGEVQEFLDRFENKYGIILYSPETCEIAVKNFLVHSIIKGGAPVRDCLIKEMKSVKAKWLITSVFSHLMDKPTYNDQVNDTVKKLIAEVMEGAEVQYCHKKNDSLTNRGTIRGQNADNENENENDNENENEKNNVASFHDADTESFTDSSEQPEPKPKKQKPTKQKYGEFQNVRLTEEEFDKLGDEFGIVIRTSAIDYLDAYIEEKGYKSKSHNLAIRRWVVDAVNERISKSTERNVANGHDTGNLGKAQRVGNYI